MQMMRRIVGLNCARTHSSRDLGPYVEAHFPFRRLLCSGGVFCASHKQLDGFIALRDDDVWRAILPPNSWGCGCLIQRLSVDDGLLRPDVSLPGIIRLPPEILRSCTDWQETDPTNLLRFFWVAKPK
jgi:hypothetical protein